MPEHTEEKVEEATQSASAESERTFTQAEMDAIIGDRLKRERAKYADYDELKGKAAKYDEAEEASKSELQKAVEERDRLKAEVERLNAERTRADEIAKAARENGVDAELLARMSGDIAENVAFLKQQADAKPKYGQVPDGGEEPKAAAQKIEIPTMI